MSAPVVSAAAPWRGRCFPIVSFLHVPGKMSRPLWLMMGTAFPFQLQLTERSAHKASPQLLLTAKHTFAPWDYIKDASQLKIPEDYRKLRFVIGRMYRPNAEGQSVASDQVGVRLLSQHPHLDVAVLAVDTKTDSATSTNSTKAATEAGLPSASSSIMSSVVFDSPLTLCQKRYPAASDGFILGYRGRGQLGELDTLDPSLLQRLPAVESEALLKDLEDIEGKQVLASTTVSILDDKGICKGVGNMATCFHGMSGGPLLTTSGSCAGVLYGHHPNAPGCLGYTPCTDFVEWLADVVERVTQRRCS